MTASSQSASGSFWNRLLRGDYFHFTWPGIQSIFRKEIIQLLRDPYLVMFIIALPLIQLVMTGLAVTRDLSHIPVAVANYDNRSASKALVRDFENSNLFDAVLVTSENQLRKEIHDGKYRAGIVIPSDFSSAALSGLNSPRIELVVDGTNGSVAKTILNGAKLIVANHTRKMLAEVSPSVGLSPEGSALAIDMRPNILYNPDMTTSYFLVPAILAIVMHMLTILFTSFAIVRERESGTLEQLMVTPVRVPDLMLGKILPYAMIGFLDMLLTLGVMVWFFDIHISGSFGFLCFASIIFILCSLGMGLLISILCHTQVQAIQLTVAIFLPSLLLTGFVFPLEPMPWFIKIISYSLPLTYYLDVIRGVVVKHSGLMEMWPQTSILAGMALVMLTISILRFNKQIS